MTPPHAPPPPPAQGTSFEACTVSDSAEAKSLDGFAVAGSNVYVAYDSFVHRYTPSASGACTLTRDASFESGGMVPGQEIHGDASGGLWTRAFFGAVARVAPGPTMTCTVDASLSSLNMLWFAIDSGGSVGYALYAAPLEMGKITIGPSSCSIAPLTLSATVPGETQGGAVDDQGRLHVAGTSDSSHQQVQIFGTDGSLVTTYTNFDGSTPLDTVADLTRCGAGICLLEGQEAAVAAFDDAGKGRAVVDAPGVPASTMASGFLTELVAGGASGPMYVASLDRPASANTVKIVIQRAAVP